MKRQMTRKELLAKRRASKKKEFPPVQVTFEPVELPALAVMEKVLITGDLAALSGEERLQYYRKVCETLHLNPLTRPFDYITLQGRMTLYARKDCTDQLRRIYNISLKIVSREFSNDLCTVTAQARFSSGRQDEDIGSVSLIYPRMVQTHDGKRPHPHAGEMLKGEDLANAIMKCNTKAKRRVTLSICGLGFYDETELDQFESEPGEAALPPPQLPAPTAPVVTDENYGELICHVGRAQGEMLGRKVSELKVELLQWLNDNFGTKWAKSGATKQDLALKKAVQLALRKGPPAAQAAAGVAGDAPVAPEPTPPANNTKSLLVARIGTRAEKELRLKESTLLKLLVEQGLATAENKTLNDLTLPILHAIDERWKDLEKAAAEYIGKLQAAGK